VGLTTLVSTHEIADRLGVEKNTVHMWRYRNLGFPAPTWQLAVGPIWEWSVVEEWARQSGRL